jgi:PAS domain S-box-containing protein
MKNVGRPPVDAAELRGRAEERLRQRAGSGPIGRTSPDDAQRLVHELQVHQIELEMQNESLEQALTEIEAGLQRYSDLYDFAPVGYLTLGRDGMIRKANLASARLLGLERSRVVGRRFGLFVAASSRPAFAAFLERVFESRAKGTCEVAIEGEGGGPLSVHIEAVATEDGQEIRAVLLDVTELKKHADALQDADRRRNDFLAALSHELRNPLMPIVTSLCILEHAEPGGDESRRAQAVARRQVEQLARLVDDLLDITRITRNKIQLQPQRLDLNELVSQTVEDYQPQFERGEVSLELTPAAAPVYLFADGNRLAQVIGNLLHNALKFAGRRGAARVQVTTDLDALRAVVRIGDAGIGMTPAMLSRLFEPFSQADSALDRTNSGLGLGLAIAKNLVELHGGDISVRSDGLGKGAEFTVRLPLTLESGGSPPTPKREIAPSPRRILIIDDNVDGAYGLSVLLKRAGHEVAVAYNGPQGIERARELPPDAVLCDIGLPGADGYEVARAFRRDDALKEVYLVALTGYARPEDVQRALEAGFDAHLAKPPLVHKLKELLATVPRLPSAASSRAPSR